MNAAEEDIVIAECQLVHEYLSSTGRLPRSCRDAVHLAETMRQLTDVAATGADFRTLQVWSGMYAVHAMRCQTELD